MKKDRIYFWNRLIWLVSLIRFGLVFLIFYSPPVAEILSLTLDTIDAPVAFKAGFKWNTYTRYDKIWDLWWYVFILMYVRNLSIFPVMLALFLLRIIGQIFTIATGKHKVLFWFPNIYEHFFILYLLAKYLWPQYLQYFTGIELTIPLLIATITKIPQEYLLHRYCPENDWHPVIKKVYKKIR